VTPLVLIATVPSLLRGVAERPVLSGPTQTEDIDGFRIHYTVEGADAVDLEPAADDETLGVRCEGAAGLRAALVSVDERGRRLRTAYEDDTGGLVLERRRGHAARLVVAGTDDALDATCTRYEPRTCGCAGSPGTPGVAWPILFGRLALRRRPVPGAPS